MSTPFTIDSLVANEFHLEIGGVTLGGVFRVSGFASYASDANGERLLPPFEISKMVQRDPHLPFNQWHRETVDARKTTTRPRRDLVLLAVDDGTVTRRWTIKNAWIMQVRYSALDSASFELVEEIYTIGYEDIEEEFLA